jgi:hypothetical protein
VFVLIKPQHHTIIVSLAKYGGIEPMFQKIVLIEPYSTSNYFQLGTSFDDQ